MRSHSTFDRIVLIVLDSLGVGAMPDAATFGDEDSDSLGHICEHRPLEIPHLQLLGIGNIRPLAHVPSFERPQGAYGRLALASNGKNTTTGHWEMAGIRPERAFPTYSNGFPREIIQARDLCVLTADHGCDPATPSTDHSREYVPVLGFGPKVPWGVNLGSRKSLSDIGQTVAENFGTTLPFGESFLSQLISLPFAG